MSDQNGTTVPQSTGSVNFEQNLVKEAAQQQMSVAEAVAEKPVMTIGGVSAATPAPVSHLSVVEAEQPATVPSFNRLTILPFITLSYGNPYMLNLKELKGVTLELKGVRETYNLYNPFTKANPAKHTHQGLIRKVFAKIVELIRETEGTRVLYLGDVRELEVTANAIASQLASSLIRQLPVPQDEVLFELEQVEGGGDIALKFGDLFTVKFWTNLLQDDVSWTMTLNMNLVINAGALYDSEEPFVFVERAQTFVQNMLNKLECEDVNPCIVVAINSNGLQDELTRSFIDVLVNDMDYTVVSRNSVLRGKEDWIAPESADALFVDNTDIALFAHAFPEETDEEELDGDEGEEAGDEDEDDEGNE